MTRSQSKVTVTFAYELAHGTDELVFFSPERPDKFLREMVRSGIMLLQGFEDEHAWTAVPMSQVEQIRVEALT